MFRELRLTNFKSFAEEQTIPFAPVTLFVGANASGKSNAFDALRFLRGLVGRRLTVAECLAGKWEGEALVHPPLRGGLAEMCWDDNRTFQIETRLTVFDDPRYDVFRTDFNGRVEESTADHGPWELKHQVEVRLAALREGHPSSAAISSEGLWLCQPEGCKPIVRGELGDDSRARLIVMDRKPTSIIRKAFDSSILPLGRRGRFPYRPMIAGIRDTMASLKFFDFKPSAMRNYVDPRLPELGTHGENLSGIVHRIIEEDDCRILEWLSELGTPAATEIQFDRNALGEVLLQLREQYARAEAISARSLSDGTLRFLAYLAAMFSAPPGSVLLFEEIENGLHPTRIHLLVELFEQLAANRNVQVVATTHSSQVLLSLSREALENVVLFARDEEHPGTIVRRLGDLPHFDEVIQRTHIDELFTTGWLERAV